MNSPETQKTLLYLDRYEGQYAVLIDPQTHATVNIPRNYIPNNTSEGTYVSINITQDLNTTQAVAEEANKLIHELTGDNDK